MTPTQAVAVLRKVRAYRPAQAIDELTVDAWHEALHETPYDDALAAITNLARASSDWIDPAKIITEVRKIRNARIEHHGIPIPPADLDLAEEIDWTRQARHAIGDGHHVPGRGVHHDKHQIGAA